MADPEKVTQIVEAFAQIYTNHKLSEMSIAMYCRVLSDIPNDLLEAAALAHVRTGKFFPTPAELVELATEVAFEGMPLPLEAWREVKSQVMSWCVVFSHPLIEEAINCLGGMKAFGQSNEDEEPSWRARFCEVYAGLVKRAKSKAAEHPDVATVRRQLSRPLEPGARLSDTAGDVQRITAGVARKLTGGGNGKG